MPKPKVILISGIYNTGKVLSNMQINLIAAGFIVEKFVPSPNDASVSLGALAVDLELFVNNCCDSKEGVVIIGFSMGGLIARYYVQKLDLGKHVRKLITISSPHHGSLWAWILPKIGASEMRPNSSFLLDLENSSWPNVPCVCLWTPYDLTILPAKSSQLLFAKNISIKAWSHMAMMRDPQVIAVVRSELNQL